MLPVPNLLVMCVETTVCKSMQAASLLKCMNFAEWGGEEQVGVRTWHSETIVSRTGEEQNWEGKRKWEAGVRRSQGPRLPKAAIGGPGLCIKNSIKCRLLQKLPLVCQCRITIAIVCYVAGLMFAYLQIATFHSQWS